MEKHTGIFITKDELERVNTAMKVSGMWLSGGRPMCDTPEHIVFELTKKYCAPQGSGLDPQTGEFIIIAEADHEG